MERLEIGHEPVAQIIFNSDLEGGAKLLKVD